MNFFSARPFSNINRNLESNANADAPPVSNEPFFGNDSGPSLHPVGPSFDNFFGNDKEELPDGSNSFLNFFGNAGTSSADTEERPTGIFGNDNDLTYQVPFPFIEYGSVAANGMNNGADNTISGYHFLDLVPGQEYTISALREEYDLDPGMWLFEGHHSFQDFIDSGTLNAGNTFTNSTIGYLTSSDDVIPHPGPFSDPSNTIIAPESGKVTVVVTEVISGLDHGGDGRFDYRLEVTPTPDPEEESGFFDHGEPNDGATMLVGIPGFFGNDLFIA